MSPLDPALGGFGSKWNYSPGNIFDLRPEFGQSSNRFRYFGPEFGQTSYHGYPFGYPYAPANLGTSMSPFINTYPFGFTLPGHTSHPFGFYPSNAESSVPTFGHNSTTPFGCATGGTFTPTLRQNSTTPFGFSPPNGGTSVPTFGQSTASRHALIRGGTPSNTTSAPAWQSSNPLGSVPTNAGTPATTFGEGGNYFASALTNGRTSVPARGAPLSSTLMQAASSSPIRRSLSGSTSFSQTPAVNASSSPGFSFDCTMTCSQPTLPSGTSSLFGSDPYLFGTQNHLPGGGVDAASAQLNSFWNPVSRTCSSFLNAMPSSIPPNIFASKPPCFTFPTCSTPFTSNSFSDDSHRGTYTSITETPSISSASARKASTSGPSLFNYTSAPCASIWSTSVTAPVTVSVPCNFPPSISPLAAVLPSKCSTETPLAVPQMSAEGPKVTSVRYGISSIPVKLLADEEQKQSSTSNCNRKGDGPVVAFSTDAHETPTTARKKVPLLPKDNSGVLISGPSEERTLRINFENISHIKHASIHVYKNGDVSVEFSKPLADSSMQDKVVNPVETFAAEHSLESNSVNGNHPSGEEVPSNVSWLLPKLKHSDYFIQPRVEELAIKESFEPGFCSHVKDFVVGHKRYGCIKFLGETDVRQFDVDSHVKFRNREVILSMDENKKPPVGQGLKKAAEITLCNIKCIDKAGNQHIRGPKVDKYEKELMKKAAEQGAEFVSYDPVLGEWKFRVKLF